jgi:adenylosuccinate synthase
MSCALIVGAQWGDEGKGKIVDLVASNLAQLFPKAVLIFVAF